MPISRCVKSWQTPAFFSSTSVIGLAAVVIPFLYSKFWWTVWSILQASSPSGMPTCGFIRSSNSTQCRRINNRAAKVDIVVERVIAVHRQRPDIGALLDLRQKAEPFRQRSSRRFECGYENR